MFQAFHTRRVRLFTDQLVEANPILTEISDCMTGEGSALDAADAEAAETAAVAEQKTKELDEALAVQQQKEDKRRDRSAAMIARAWLKSFLRRKRGDTTFASSPMMQMMAKKAARHANPFAEMASVRLTQTKTRARLASTFARWPAACWSKTVTRVRCPPPI